MPPRAGRTREDQERALFLQNAGQVTLPRYAGFVDLIMGVNDGFLQCLLFVLMGLASGVIFKSWGS